ncbi:unnamed protein product [Symbiodinium natans]|uniref:Uncharacterized protein n=1 Tax=Symbiodinium natans TaxID=878477 RepID=A0A812TRS8_9DINO|nr:unnamed protein product [Symbiodinium natans]
MARGSCEALEARILELRQRREELASQLKALGNPDEALLPHCSLDVDLELQLDSLTCLLRASIWALEVVDEQIEVVRDLLPEYVKAATAESIRLCLHNVPLQIVNARFPLRPFPQLSNMQTVKASAQRVAGELQRELSIEEVEARKVGDRQRLLLEAGAASRDIEELLASRVEATAARCAAHDYLKEQQPRAAQMCLQSEKERGCALEELLAGWHAEVWGPEAKELAKDAQMVGKLKSLHGRAASLLHQAWKETVQLAAESLGDGSALGEASQDISRAAERYKELQKNIKSNVDRMAAWLAEAEGGERSGGSYPERAPINTQVSTEEVVAVNLAAGSSAGSADSSLAEMAPAQAGDEGLEDAE